MAYSQPQPQQRQYRASAYNDYMKMRIPQIKAEQPGIDHKTAFKSAAAEWKTISQAARAAAV